MTDETGISRTLTLPRGYVDEEGRHHREATLRLPTVDDEMQAEEKAREEGFSRQNQTAYFCAYVARCLVSLGKIPEPKFEHLRRMRSTEIAMLRDRIQELEAQDLQNAQAQAAGDPGNDTPTPEPS